MAKTALEQFLAEQRDACNRFYEDESYYVEENATYTEERIYQCPPIFDGLLCWPATIASQTAILPCPPRAILAFALRQFAFSASPLNNTTPINPTTTRMDILPVASKLCTANGQWYGNSDGLQWSNYSLCSAISDRHVTTIIDLATGNRWKYQKLGNALLLDKWLPIIKRVSQIGYASSFVTLVVAMFVFSILRKLRNPRNTLHMHLFTSFMMRAFMALLKDWVFVDGVGLAWDIVFVDGKSVFIKERNTWACKAITSTWQYFIVANYSWILMEGLYLHNLIFLAVYSDTNAITSYVLLGWGLPALVVVPWVVIRATIEDTLCWTTHRNPFFFLIVKIPIVVSILFNFLLFLNIVRVLHVKLKMSVHLERKKMKYRRWAKSTLVLVPLFGAHYTLFLGLSYHKNNQIELIWLFCDQLFASFQGAFVALLYCLLNGEVRAEMRRTLKRINGFSLIQREFWRVPIDKIAYEHRQHGRKLNLQEIKMKELSVT